MDVRELIRIHVSTIFLFLFLLLSFVHYCGSYIYLVGVTVIRKTPTSIYFLLSFKSFVSLVFLFYLYSTTHRQCD